jgi:hypothetical protein
MMLWYGSILAICIIWTCLVGCGVTSRSPNPPNGNACAGIIITGTLQDSLTNRPVAQGWAVLESGAQISGTKLYTFSTIKQIATDAGGKFRLCSTTVSSPLTVVTIALDSSNNAYPPFVAPVSGTIDLGTIPMGGCHEKCGFEGQQQTSPAATIMGMITTTPTAKTGTVVPEYSMNALDGSNNLWNLTMPVFNTSQSFSFTTALTGCTREVPFCAPYTFVVPSQKPVWAVKDGYMQGTGAPVYSIYATAPSCTPPSAFSSFQQDGNSPLLGAPGVKLSAATINFSACK